MNVVAVREDGALLVVDVGSRAAVVSDGAIWVTTRDAALARGEWAADDRPVPTEVVAELAARFAAAKAEQ